MPSTPNHQPEQQRAWPANRQQQQSASSPEFQSKSAGKDSSGSDKPQAEKQMGEGSYEATRDYQDNIKTYLDKADVKADAEAAKPASKEEADELKKAEDAGLSHTKAPGQ
jgi:hypothetical protein